MDILTQKSLLDRLKDSPGESDWELFYRKYWAVILSFAQKRGLDEHGARDVLQETMIVLMQKLPAFTYDAGRGKFRNWLLTIVTNKSREALRRAHQDRLVPLDASQSGSKVGWKDKLAAETAGAAEGVESSWRQSLLEEALRSLHADPQTKRESLDIFQAYVLENKPVAEVAARFGIKENAIYQIKNRLLKRLQGIVAELEESSGTAATPPETK